MFQRLWAAAAVLAVSATPLFAQNPPAPPPQPSPNSTDTTRAQRPLPPPRRRPPPNVTVTAGVPTPALASSTVGITLDSTLLAGFRWRNIGPANMGGRVSSVTDRKSTRLEPSH